MVKELIKRYHFIIPLGLSFYILDFFIRYANLNINFASIISLAPSFFTLAWVTLFVAIILFFGLKYRKTFYITLIIFFSIMMLVNYVYFKIFNTFFSFKSIALAGEGMNYSSAVLSYMKLPIITTFISCIVLVILSCKFFPKTIAKSDKFIGLLFLIISLFSYGAGRHSLGQPADKLAWNAWDYKRNIYGEYSETRKSIQVSGLYE